MVLYVEPVGLSVADFPALSDKSAPLQPLQGFLYGFIVQLCRVGQHADCLLHVSHYDRLVEHSCYCSAMGVSKEAG